MIFGSEILEPAESGLTQRVVSNGNFAAICYDDYTTVLPTDTITSGGNYVDEDISVLGGYSGRKVVFTIDGTSYAVYEGTVWGAFFGNAGAVDCPVCGDNGYVGVYLSCEACFAEFIFVDESGNEVSLNSGIEEGNYFIREQGIEITINGTSYDLPSGHSWFGLIGYVEENVPCYHCGSSISNYEALYNVYTCNDCDTQLILYKDDGTAAGSSPENGMSYILQ